MLTEWEDQRQGPDSAVGSVTHLLGLRSSCREEGTCRERMGEQASLKGEVVGKMSIRKKKSIG